MWQAVRQTALLTSWRRSTKELQFFTPQTKCHHGNKRYGCARCSGIESLLVEHCTAMLLCELCENCWHCVTYWPNEYNIHTCLPSFTSLVETREVNVYWSATPDLCTSSRNWTGLNVLGIIIAPVNFIMRKMIDRFTMQQCIFSPMLFVLENVEREESSQLTTLVENSQVVGYTEERQFPGVNCWPCNWLNKFMLFMMYYYQFSLLYLELDHICLNA